MNKLVLGLIFILIQSVNTQWETDVRLTNAPEESRTTFNHSWCVAASGSIVHAAWYDERDGNYEIYYKRSTDEGLTWGNDIRLTNNSTRSETPSIAVSGSFVHIAWYENITGNGQTHYIRSTDSGVSWGNIVTLVNNTSESASYLSLSVSGSNLHLAWADSRGSRGEVYYKRSTNNGSSWGSDVALTNQSSASNFPCIASSGSSIHVVWYDDRDGTEEIYYKRSTNNGTSWGSDTRLSALTGNSNSPCIAVSGQMIHVVWEDSRSGPEHIFYKSSSNNGSTWGPDMLLTTNSNNGVQPSIAASGQVVHVTWVEGGALGALYYSRSQDNGANWESKTRLNVGIPLARYPSICLSGTIVHLVWHDGRNGAYEIYYKRNISGNALPVEIAYFNSVLRENNVSLNWGTVWELNNSGFDIERSSSTGNWLKAGHVTGNGTTTEEQHYTFTDINLTRGTYKYRLKQIDYNGNYEYHSLANEVQVGAPKSFQLGQNYPNPSNPKSKIDFHVPVSGNISLKVYDINGREAAVLAEGYYEADFYSMEFDGSSLSSGVYFYRFNAGGFTETKKMLLIK